MFACRSLWLSKQHISLLFGTYESTKLLNKQYNLHSVINYFYTCCRFAKGKKEKIRANKFLLCSEFALVWLCYVKRARDSVTEQIRFYVKLSFEKLWKGAFK